MVYHRRVPNRFVALLASLCMVCCGPYSTPPAQAPAPPGPPPAPALPLAPIAWFPDRNEVHCRPESSRLVLPGAGTWEIGVQDASSLVLISRNARDRSSAVLTPTAVVIIRASAQASLAEFFETLSSTLHWMVPAFEDD